MSSNKHECNYTPCPKSKAYIHYSLLLIKYIVEPSESITNQHTNQADTTVALNLRQTSCPKFKSKAYITAYVITFSQCGHGEVAPTSSEQVLRSQTLYLTANALACR